MKITSRQIKFAFAILLLAAFLTAFYYAHESFPKPLRAATAILAAPVAIASGISHYLNLGIPVYETPWAVILTNLLFSVFVIFAADKFISRIAKHYGDN
jgi:tellurite resistance protein TehA-like permease